VDPRACVASADMPAVGAAGLVADASADVPARCPMDRTDVESARMSLYAPRCAAICDRSRHPSCVPPGRSTAGEAHARSGVSHRCPHR
jgi:hypothetical protein